MTFRKFERSAWKLLDFRILLQIPQTPCRKSYASRRTPSGNSCLRACIPVEDLSSSYQNKKIFTKVGLYFLIFIMLTIIHKKLYNIIYLKYTYLLFILEIPIQELPNSQIFLNPLVGSPYHSSPQPLQWICACVVF